MRTSHVLNTFKKMKARNWDTLYWAIDVHDTVIKANYSTSELPTEFFPLAKNTLQRLSKRSDCVLILFTCSHSHDVEQYLEFFREHDIHFKYVNENPEVTNTKLGCYDGKFYTNFYLDDKAGFDASSDWININIALNELEQENNQSLD